MTDSLVKLTAPYMTLSPAKRWVVGVVAVLSILGFGSLIMLSNRIDYKPLFANLSNEDTGEIVKKLKEQKVSYRIAADGKAILVPSNKVYDLRISLASEGLPQGGGVGFEIFDRKNFGMTEFVQKLNYQRALQGELSRTIMQIAGVEHARVHLAIPEKSLFKDNEKLPTASIVLQMKSGRLVRESEVQGIVHLVASSVEGMDPEQVTVLDSRGKIMSRSGPADVTGKMTSTMMETQRSYEKNLEERLQSLLDRAVGSGKSVARVSTVLNFNQVEKVEERYDPNAKVIRSEQRTEQKDGTTLTTSGIPGVQPNTGKTNAVPLTAVGGSKRDETMNYEINRSSSKIIEPVGTLTKLSVAILVDGKYEPGAAVKSGKAAKPKYIPRSPEELQKIEALVKSAAGYNIDRGDQLTVVNIPFQETGDETPGVPPEWWEKPFFADLGKNILLGIAFIALLLLVVRPLMKTLSSPKRGRDDDRERLEAEKDPQEQLEGGVHGLLTQPGIEFKGQGELLALVKQDPYQTAQILQNWINKTA
jgi:flagellar M-ring protein FliF